MRLALVLNERSGTASAVDGLPALLEGLGAQVERIDVREVDRLVDLDVDRLVVAGGDGSVGPVAKVAAARGLPLVVVPAGTANDFARAMDLPTDPEAAARLAVEGQDVRMIELARAAGRPFVNVAACGLSVAAADAADALKSRLGPVAYLVGAVRAGLTSSPVEVRVVVDGREVHDGQAWQVIVAASGTFGGSSELDVADPEDQRLDVAVLADAPRIALVRRAWGMRLGGLVDQPGVEHHRGEVVEVHGDVQWNVDGELCDVAGGRFTVDDGQVPVVVG